MPTDNILIQEADHKQAEKNLFEGTKGLHKPVNKRINGGN